MVPNFTQPLSVYGVSGGAGRALAGALASTLKPSRLLKAYRSSVVAMQITIKEGLGMQSQSNEFRPQASQRLFLAVVHQAISDVLENGKEAKEAERWLLSNDFDILDRLFVLPAKASRIAIGTKPGRSDVRAKDRTQAAMTVVNPAPLNCNSPQ